jgi:hypothetical protein
MPDVEPDVDYTLRHLDMPLCLLVVMEPNHHMVVSGPQAVELEQIGVVDCWSGKMAIKSFTLRNSGICDLQNHSPTKASYIFLR